MLTTDLERTTSYPLPEKKIMRQGILQEQPRIIVPPEISAAEYLEASDHAEKQGREDGQEILQTILRIRAQGKRKFEKASTK